MVFSSNLFIFYFLPLALLAHAVCWRLLPRAARHLGLLLSSYAFYAWSNPALVLILLFSTAVDYACGLALDRPGASERRRRLAVTASVATNLGVLGFFKYFNFGVETWNRALGAAGLEGYAVEDVLRVALPLGISFYTFQSMSYTLDVYRGRARALANPIDFACYVAMFPQLVAGPIIRFREVADQLQERTHGLEKAARGAAFFCLGMAKKILLANPCGQVADLAFEARALTMLDAWLGIVAYAFQIYFDFSGYTDMAIGLGLILGFQFPKNFDSPYRATSITDFWRRWHMSLSRWLRDYLYIPLGGNRRGRGRTYVNLMIVMLLGGLWHGAAWTFVVWGLLHGLLLTAERLARDRRAGRPSAGRLHAVRVAWTFLLVLITWVFFRAETLPDAIAYLVAMLGQGAPPGEAAAAAALVSGVLRAPYLLATLALSALIVWRAPQTWDYVERLSPPKVAVLLALLTTSLLMMNVQGYNPFLYFIF
ncbi:MAG: MBOAT family protein [Acidobacteriota bacterium]